MVKYRVALAGTGSRGSHHLMAFKENSDRFDVVAVADINPDSVAKAADKYGVPKIYLSADEMLAAEKPDVFCFATQPHLRMELAKLAAKHNVKAMAYEKPMAIDLAEAREMAQLTTDNNIKAIVSHQMKYGGHFQNVKRLIDEGQLGDLHTIHVTSKGWMGPYMTHLVDYMLHFNNYASVDWVLGTAHGRDYFDDAHPSPGYIAAIVQFANGVRGIVESGPMAPHVPDEESFWFDSRMAVYGYDGYAHASVGKGWQAVTASVPGVQGGEDCWNADHDQPLYIRDLANWLDDDAKVHPCNDKNALKGFEIVMATCMSVVEHRRIDFPYEPPSTSVIDALGDVLPETPRMSGA